MASRQVEDPYAPSWLNRLINWIAGAPGPTWFYFLLGILLMGMIFVVASWLVGIIPIGTIETDYFLYGIYPVYFVALMHYLDGQAKSALERFRPTLAVNDTEYRRIEFELTTVPALGAWIATTLAVALGLLIVLSDEADPLIHSGEPLGLAVVGISTIFTVACLLIFAYHTVRQLRMVSHIHTLATAINLYYAGPVYAFSELTARTGIGFIFFASILILLDPPDPSDIFGYLLIAAIAVMAVAAFMLPLLGMHHRLVKEKAQLQLEINDGVKVAYTELQECVRTRNYAQVDDLDKVLSNLLGLREVAAKLSTWPWQAETLRGFISALLIPLLIWILTTLLERFIPF